MSRHWVENYLGKPYEDGARGPDRFDCWGLVRHVRHAHCGARLLPSWGHVRNTMPREFTRAYAAESAKMRQCEPEPGAIAAVFRGMLCIHVGVVVEIDGRLAVLEINQRSGVRWLRVPDFERQYIKVRYYAD